MTKLKAKIIWGCCALAMATMWWIDLSALRRLAPGLVNRFENVATTQLMSKAAQGSFATTDRYLSELEIPQPSEAFLKANIPPGDAVIFISGLPGPWSELTYRSIAYLSWPRQIGEVRCGEAGTSPELSFHPQNNTPIKWLMFYRIATPRELAHVAQNIGPHLTLAPVTELKDWTFYCQQ